MKQSPFTFYGDLLGISQIYRISKSAALEKLNLFYNESFTTLRGDLGINVEMFSDSLIISGNDALSVVSDIGNLYSNLLRQGILLRGAMIHGELRYQVRLTRDNFKKRLPEDDSLARVVALEKSEAGARFIIDSLLAEEFFKCQPSWKTHEGYVQSKATAGHDALRRICPTPNNSNYEYLYYWTEGIGDQEYFDRIKALKEIMPTIDCKARKHYKETIALIQRCQHRHHISKENFSERSY